MSGLTAGISLMVLSEYFDGFCFFGGLFPAVTSAEGSPWKKSLCTFLKRWLCPFNGRFSVLDSSFPSHFTSSFSCRSLIRRVRASGGIWSRDLLLARIPFPRDFTRQLSNVRKSVKVFALARLSYRGKWRRVNTRYFFSIYSFWCSDFIHPGKKISIWETAS